MHDTTASHTRCEPASGELCTRVFEGHDHAALESIRGPWEQLAREAAEPNLFFEPDYLLAALKHLRPAQSPDHAQPRIVTLWRGEELVALFPVEESRRLKRLPIRHLRLWTHLHCFYGAPLVRANMERAVVASFYSWLSSSRRPSTFVWNQIDGEGPFREALRRHLEAGPAAHFQSETFDRPMYRRCATAQSSYEEFLNACFSSGHRKDLLRKLRRLRDAGTVSFEMRDFSAPGTGSLDAWIEEFLALEAAGWKGRAGTAIACSERETLFFKEAISAYARKGRFIGNDLRLDGRMVAARLDFRVADGLMSLKVAFDESLAAVSPGVLLRHLQQERIHGSPEIGWIDSCSTPEYRRGDRLMPHSRTIETLCTSHSFRDRVLLQYLVPLASGLRRGIRGVTAGKPDPRAMSKEQGASK